MPTSPFTVQPARVPDATEIPKSYAHASRLMNGSLHLKIADELWLVKSYRPRADAIDLVFFGICIISYDRATEWMMLNTNGFSHYRAVLDIFKRALAGSLLSVRSNQSDTSENWANFQGGRWEIGRHNYDPATEGPTAQPHVYVPFVDMMAVHPATGHVEPNPFAVQGR